MKFQEYKSFQSFLYPRLKISTQNWANREWLRGVLQSSGTDFNVVPLDIYQKLNLHHDHYPGNLKISAYNNLDFQTQKRTIQSAANTKSVHVLGLESCKNPKLIKCKNKKQQQQQQQQQQQKTHFSLNLQIALEKIGTSVRLTTSKLLEI